RAGSLAQKLETYSAFPAPAPSDIVFGIGKRAAIDAVRVLWPAGIVQAETEIATNKALSLTELDRKPSSCPYLYVWNGTSFEFVTDFMGGGEMGHLDAPGVYNTPDPDEYVRIPSGLLKEKNGRFEFRVTNELEEAIFFDRMQLVAIAHPRETEVYPNEGLTVPAQRFKLFTTRDAKPPLTAVDDHGHDVLERILRIDREYPDDFKLHNIRGFADEHTLTLRLPDQNRVRLLLTGWTDYAWSSDNLAASQSGKALSLPALQVKDKRGEWKTVIENIGIPVGRPQTVIADLTGKFLSESREVRIVTNMRIYWDQILVDTSGGDFATRLTRLSPTVADLRWRGFSHEYSPNGRDPMTYDYSKVSFTSPWKVMTGRYTREGDVRPLLSATDDIFVISRPGDELILSFDARKLPPLPKGWKHTFLLYADGFSKEMDINSASPDQVGPLPFHGMSKYPYSWPERYPLTLERQRYLETYNTRVVTSQVATLY
ncbi:MAG TPA: ASPIC/UnbV domain-containing protein, partial [Pyrinomonadaceae bacterium]